jgi:acyl carrier protein
MGFFSRIPFRTLLFDEGRTRVSGPPHNKAKEVYLMVISSRTPEGLPNRCPICGNSVRLESSLPFGDAPCPSCGHLLWFLTQHSETHFFPHEKAQDIQERIITIISENLGIDKEILISNPSWAQEIGPDVIKLVMELEEELET